MTDDRPFKISVLTPSFNSAKYIRRAIDSVLRQRYDNWEHIIMDGGSKDGTIDILNSYSHLIWESAIDKGQSDAMNKAFKKSSGDLILYLNADDELEDLLFPQINKLFKEFPAADMIVGNLRVNNKGVIELRTPSISLFAILKKPQKNLPHNPVVYPYRRSLQDRIGLFPVDNHYTMDYWFLLRAYLFGKIVKADFTGGTFYLDGTNKSSDFKRSNKSLHSDRVQFAKTYFFRPTVTYYFFYNTILSVVKVFRSLFGTKKLTKKK